MSPPRKPLSIAAATAELTVAQNDWVDRLSAAADRRDAAAAELRDATRSLHELALLSHAEGLPTMDILRGARMKESWFHQIKAKARKAADR